MIFIKKFLLIFSIVLMFNQSCNLYAETQQILTIIKPDALESGYVGDILSRFEHNNFRIINLRMEKLTREKVRQFYEVHEGAHYFQKLVSYMCSGPVIILILEGEDAIAKGLELKGSLRADFAKSITEDTIHTSDSLENAAIEIRFFFEEY